MAVSKSQALHHSLTVATFNADGLKKQKFLLVRFLTEHRIDIALIQETHFTNRIKEWRLPNYLTYRLDRVNRQKGGLLILVKRDFPTREINIPPLRTLEAIGIEILTPGVPLILVSGYRSPATEIEPADFDIIANLGPKVVLAGDLNAKHAEWNSKINNDAGDDLHAYLLTSVFNITAPRDPTHYPKFGGRPDVLDVVLSKNVPLTTQPYAISALDSDHEPVIFQLSHRTITTVPPDIKVLNTDWDLFRLELNSMINLRERPRTKEDIDQAVAHITFALRKAEELSTTTASVHKSSGPADSCILKMYIHLKRWARRRWQQTYYQPYKTLWNKLSSKIKVLTQKQTIEYWETTFQGVKTNDSRIWSYSRAFLKSKDTTRTTVLKGPRGMLHNPQSQADLFADTLQEQFQPNREQPRDRYLEQHVRVTVDTMLIQQPVQDPKQVTPREIQQQLKNLPNKKSPGKDNIRPELLKHGTRKLLVYLAYLFNSIFQLCYFPRLWKEGKIITIPKPGKSPLKPENYRPISLLSHLGKLFERILLTRLQQHATDQSLIPTHQFGFRAHHSTTSQLVRVVDYITTAFNRRQYALGVYLDISKAFDKVWLQGLLYKLQQYGFADSYIHLLRSYLIGRTFYVTCGGCRSTTRPIRAGVPQGAVLSPLLYSLYTADVPITDRCFAATYADDTAFFTVSQRLNLCHSYLQEQLNAYQQWATRWRLQINAEKSVAVLYSKRRKDDLPPLTYQNKNIPYRTQARYLGITLDRGLTFSKHITEIKSRALRKVSALYTILRCAALSHETRVHVFRAIILSTLTYASPSWQHAAPSHLAKLESVQTKVGRIITGHDRYTRNIQILQDLDLHTIRDILSYMHTKFWRNLPRHANEALAKIGTDYSRRRTHRTPRLQ